MTTSIDMRDENSSQKTTDDPPINIVEDIGGNINILVGASLALRIRDGHVVLLFINKEHIARRLTKHEAVPILSKFIARHNELLDCMAKVESALSSK